MACCRIVRCVNLSHAVLGDIIHYLKIVSSLRNNISWCKTVSSQTFVTFAIKGCKAAKPLLRSNVVTIVTSKRRSVVASERRSVVPVITSKPTSSLSSSSRLNPFPLNFKRFAFLQKFVSLIYSRDNFVKFFWSTMENKILESMLWRGFEMLVLNHLFYRGIKRIGLDSRPWP